MQTTLNIFFDPYLLPGMQNLLRDKFLSSIRSSRRPEARPLRSPGRGCDPVKHNLNQIPGTGPTGKDYCPWAVVVPQMAAQLFLNSEDQGSKPAMAHLKTLLAILA